MRLINLDDILKQFPKADFDGDDLENMKAYPHWKTDITGLFNILKSVPIIEVCEDCVSREEIIDEINRMGINAFKTYNNYSELFDFVDSLPSVTPSYNSIKTELDCVNREEAKQFLYERIDRLNDDELYDIYSRIIDDMYNDLPSVTPQEPILDKMRAEIKSKIIKRPWLDFEDRERDRNDAFLEVLDIIDKYKAESEGEK